jgi:hypothetical protein
MKKLMVNKWLVSAAAFVMAIGYGTSGIKWR